MIRRCAIILGTFSGLIFGYHFGILSDFWVSFFGYSRIFGVIFFLVKFDFFKNNPDFLVLIFY